MAKQTFTAGGRTYTVTHELLVEVHGWPAGTLVHLLASRSEGAGRWSCMLVSPVLSKAANSYQFVTDFTNLRRIK